MNYYNLVVNKSCSNIWLSGQIQNNIIHIDIVVFFYVGVHHTSAASNLNKLTFFTMFHISIAPTRVQEKKLNSIKRQPLNSLWSLEKKKFLQLTDVVVCCS